MGEGESVVCCEAAGGLGLRLRWARGGFGARARGSFGARARGCFVTAAATAAPPQPLLQGGAALGTWHVPQNQDPFINVLIKVA